MRQGEKFDLIYLDAGHGCETATEMALISCLASDNCTFIADDVINYNNDMTSAWAIAVKNYLAFPRFYGSLSAANFKSDLFPFNQKWCLSVENAAILKDHIWKACKKNDLSTIKF